MRRRRMLAIVALGSAAVVTSVTASGFYAAVYINAGANGNRVQNSTLKDNVMLDTNNSS